jgi:hypothetical protein
MAKHSQGPAVLAVLIVTVGVGWLLTALKVGPGIDWVWTLGLGVVGIMTFVLSGGLDKMSVVVGPFFLVGSVLSILRQAGYLKADVEVPVLVILVGVLLFVAQLRFIPVPKWLANPPSEEDQKT